ncbi:MAG: hypothetical protein ABJ263_00115 [Tateyamaria sp.]|uniref:hypothetical protein n=1 Tax=Tateyamaria sp. TaxID=1929288 RepID=UPI0032812C46
MTALSPPNHFDDLQIALLHQAIGGLGSGASRYGAAMYFYAQHTMPASMLEIYRACSKFDHEDPIAMARHEGVDIPPISHHGMDA